MKLFVIFTLCQVIFARPSEVKVDLNTEIEAEAIAQPTRVTAELKPFVDEIAKPSKPEFHHGQVLETEHDSMGFPRGQVQESEVRKSDRVCTGVFSCTWSVIKKTGRGLKNFVVNATTAFINLFHKHE